MSNSGIEDEHPGMAIAFRGLADPYRLRVFAALQELESAELILVGESQEMPLVIEAIVRTTNISPSSVEHHLMELRRAGLVTIGEGSGGQAVVTVDQRRLALVRELLDPGAHDTAE